MKTLSALFILLFLNTEATAVPRLKFKNGRIADSIQIHFPVAYNFLAQIKSRSVELDWDSDTKDGFLSGEVRGCLIGKQQIPNSRIKIKINDSEILPLTSIQRRIRIQVFIENAEKLAGRVQCSYVSINYSK